MKFILLSLLTCCLLACGKPVDKSQCLKSHIIHHPMWLQLVPMFNGKTTTFIHIWHPAYDEQVCDQWEFPEGRPNE